jgi:hypothetical protein
MHINERISKDKCPLCLREAKCLHDEPLVFQVKDTPIAVECLRCGSFSITYSALGALDALGQYVAVSGIAREWTELKQSLAINRDNLGVSARDSQGRRDGRAASPSPGPGL